MTNIKLSQRMQTVVSLVDEKSVADIGCDHAHVAMWLAASGVKKVIAMDVKKGPVDIAKANIKANGMSDIVEVRMSDGMDKLLVGEVECAIIAGMGGELICGILERGLAKLEAGIHLILQPQSEIYKVRDFLLKHNYTIINEKMLLEDDKYYTIIKAVPSVESSLVQTEYLDIDLHFGKLLISDNDICLKKYLAFQMDKLGELKNKLSDVYSSSSQHRLMLLEEELSLVSRALAKMKD